MIQRVQSLYLFITFISLAFLFVFPILEFSSASKPGRADFKAGLALKTLHHKFFAFEETADDPATAVNPDFKQVFVENTVVIFLCMGFVLASIFLFGNRKRQIALCWLAVLCMLAETLMIYLKINSQHVPPNDRTLGIGAFLVSISLLFTLFARRSIKKDDDLVRSADRLR